MRKRAPDRFAGKRDPTLLALGFAAAFQRRAVAFEVTDLLRVSDGPRVTTLRSETDQEEWERGRRGRRSLAWLAALKISSPVFRPVLKGSRLQPEPLTDRSVTKVVERHLLLALFADDSRRAGPITSVTQAGAPGRSSRSIT